MIIFNDGDSRVVTQVDDKRCEPECEWHSFASRGLVAASLS